MDRNIPHPNRKIVVKDGNMAIADRKIELGNSSYKDTEIKLLLTGLAFPKYSTLFYT
ncbi:MAG: hypothetical protein LBL04_16260 [Bacteroidales bacterium]|nr:hypothetical protein [Bacteroidales bacterium]